MKSKLLVLFAVFFLVSQGSAALALENGDEDLPRHFFKIFARTGVGSSQPSITSSSSATTTSAPISYMGSESSIMLGLGRGLFSLNAGVSYLSLPTRLVSQDTSGVTYQHNVLNQYVGFPILARLNYVTGALSTFWLEGGVIPATLQGDATVGDSTTAGFSRPTSDLFSKIGIGGSAPLSESSGFTFDIGYMLGSQSLDTGNNKNHLLGINFGFVFNL